MNKRLRSSPILLSLAAAGAAVLLTILPKLIADGGSPRTAAVVGGLRDPAYWPFDSDSPWNRPLGEQARYTSINVPGFVPETDPVLRFTTTSGAPSIHILRKTDRPVTLMVRGRQRVAGRTRLPAGISLGDDAPMFVHLIDSSHAYAFELYSPHTDEQTRDDKLHAARIFRTNLRGLGVYESPYGYRAYGGSALGGLIRRGELRAGIPHALAVSVKRATLNRDAPGGKPFVWPACDAGEGWNLPPGRGGLGNKGNLHVGSLLALPPDVNITALDVGGDGPAVHIARALQNYGAYIVDTGQDDLAFFAEADAAREVPGNLDALLKKVVARLEVVTNNTPTTPGGGGAPRVQPAPPLLPVEP